MPVSKTGVGGSGKLLHQMRKGTMTAVIEKKRMSCWFHVSPMYLWEMI